jgi:hypothetical protein
VLREETLSFYKRILPKDDPGIVPFKDKLKKEMAENKRSAIQTPCW